MSPKTCHDKSNYEARGQASVRRYIMLFSILISAGLLSAGRPAEPAEQPDTADLKTSWKGFSLNTRWVLKTGRTDSAGTLADWNTLVMTATKKFSLKKSSLTLNLTAKNLLNSSYELVSGYPMPPRSLVGGIELGF